MAPFFFSWNPAWEARWPVASPNPELRFSFSSQRLPSVAARVTVSKGPTMCPGLQKETLGLGWRYRFQKGPIWVSHSALFLATIGRFSSVRFFSSEVFNVHIPRKSHTAKLTRYGGISSPLYARNPLSICGPVEILVSQDWGHAIFWMMTFLSVEKSTLSYSECSAYFTQT